MSCGNQKPFRNLTLKSYLDTNFAEIYALDAIAPSVKALLSGEPDYFGRNEISSGGDLSHYSSASLY